MQKVKKTGAAAKRRELDERRRKTRTRVVIGLLLLAIAAEAAFIFAKSETFNIRKIKLIGNERVVDKRILKLSGLTTGTNIFDFDAVKTAKNIASNPWIEDAAVGREFPLNVTITVTERRPFVVFQTASGFCLTDKKGTAIEFNAENQYAGVPLIKDCPYEEVEEPGDRFRSGAAENALKTALSLDKDILSTVSWISAPSIDGLALQTTGGTQIMYGKAEMTAQKNYAIKVILTEGANEGKSWQYIDVRVPSNPAAKAVG